jgi:hypothetical protein
MRQGRGGGNIRFRVDGCTKSLVDLREGEAIR